MLLKNIRLSFFFLGLLICSTKLFATNYYLATTGNDANTGTTLALPFATVAKAITKAIVAGDTIFVRTGTYAIGATQVISKSGTAAKHIVLTAYKPDLINANYRPILDFSAMIVASGNVGISMKGSYWDIYGLVIKGAGDNGMLVHSNSGVASHDDKFEFCSFTRNRDAGFQIREGSHHCLILNCDSYENADLGVGTTTLGGNADGFAPKLDVGDSIIFRGCRAWLNSDDGWDGYLKTAGTVYSQGMTTILENCWTWRNGYYWLDGSTTTSENGNGFKMGGSANKDEAHNFVLVKCLAFDNKANGYDQNNSAGSQFIYNGSSFNNGGVDYQLNNGSVTYAAGAQVVLKNSMSFGPKGNSMPTTSTTRPVTTSNNLFAKTAITTAAYVNQFISLDTTGVSGIRKLDGSLPDINFLHQKDTASKYVDKGIIIPNVMYYGTLGIPYSGVSSDIGYYETSPGIEYIFNGNGNWDIATNWVNGTIPPATLGTNDKITIDPIASGECLLNISYTLSPGAIITVMKNKKFNIAGNLTIAN